MRKKRIIISIVVILCVFVGVFFVMRFGVIGRFYNAISRYVVQDKAESEEEGPEELKYETFLDKDGNEIVVKMKKITGVVDEDGNEVEFWADTAEEKAEELTIYDNNYEGRIEKIEDNKIYFMVYKEIEFKEIETGAWKLTVKDVKNYQVIFDIDTYDLESDPHVGYDVCDFLWFDDRDYRSGGERFYSAGELEFLVGKYLKVQDCMSKDYYTGEIHKSLYFQPTSFIKSFIFSLFS